jgi:hypothetical protein
VWVPREEGDALSGSPFYIRAMPEADPTHDLPIYAFRIEQLERVKKSIFSWPSSLTILLPFSLELPLGASSIRDALSL